MSDDLTRCPGGECPRRDDSYRFRAQRLRDGRE